MTKVKLEMILADDKAKALRESFDQIQGCACATSRYPNDAITIIEAISDATATMKTELLTDNKENIQNLVQEQTRRWIYTFPESIAEIAGVNYEGELNGVHGPFDFSPGGCHLTANIRAPGIFEIRRASGPSTFFVLDCCGNCRNVSRVEVVAHFKKGVHLYTIPAVA